MSTTIPPTESKEQFSPDIVWPSYGDDLDELLAYYRAQPDLLEQLENATPEEAKRLLEEFHWAETCDPYAAMEEADRQFLAEQKEQEEELLLAYGR